MKLRVSSFLVGVTSWIVLICATANVASACLPFFDFQNDKVISNVVRPGSAPQRGPVDITPEPMPINAFGEAVLRACGEFGSKVSPQTVRQLIERIDPELIKQLVREFPNYSPAQIRDVLTRVWTQANGFEHVFCGHPKRDRVGGLHYSHRYFELQQKGQLCRIDNNLPNEEVIPQSVYTIGVSSNGVIDRKKGFSIRQNAEDIFYEGTRNFLRNCISQSKERRVCVSKFHRDASFGNFFVCSPNMGLITFYPLAYIPRGTAACN